MSLNEIISLAIQSLKTLPFGFADIVILLSFIGYFIVESTYSVSVVVRRVILLFCTSLGAIMLYKPLVLFSQSHMEITKGISEGIAVLIIWMALFLIFSLIIRKSFFLNIEPPGKIRGATIAILSIFSFWLIVGLVVHVFLSLPVPGEMKRFLTNSYFVQKTLVYSFVFDSGIQRIFFRDTSQTLHVFTVPESGSVDFRFSTKKYARSLKEEERVAKKIIDLRNNTRIPPLQHESIFSRAAESYVKRSLLLGSIKNKSNEMDQVFAELGIIYTAQISFVYNLDDIHMINSVLQKDTAFQKAIRTADYENFGVSVTDIGPYGYFVVIVLGG